MATRTGALAIATAHRLRLEARRRVGHELRIAGHLDECESTWVMSRSGQNVRQSFLLAIALRYVRKNKRREHLNRAAELHRKLAPRFRGLGIFLADKIAPDIQPVLASLMLSAIAFDRQHCAGVSWRDIETSATAFLDHVIGFTRFLVCDQRFVL